VGQNRRTQITWIVLPVALLLPVGCGKSKPERAPVRGTVYYKGDPLPGGVVAFAPDSERGGSGPPVSGEIGHDGKYELRTSDGDGLLPGWYRITVKAFPAADGKGCPLPNHYGDYDLSDLSREVYAGQTNVIDLRLE
jgi:hypothetical protein